MNILFLRQRRFDKDKDALTKIILSMDRVQNVVDDDFSSYIVQAEAIAKGFETFKRVRKNHKKVPFKHDDILESELNIYKNGHVPSICNLNGKEYLTPFDQLKNACQIVITSDGKNISYPENLKIGNKAIGQAWLSDGTEVFSPRQALAHSIKSSAQRLRIWAISFQERMRMI